MKKETIKKKRRETNEKKQKVFPSFVKSNGIIKLVKMSQFICEIYNVIYVHEHPTMHFTFKFTMHTCITKSRD